MAGRESNMRENKGGLVNCLTKKKVVVRYVPRYSALYQDPKNECYGGLAKTCARTYCTPRLLSNNQYVNVLTDAEKDFLEDYLGMEPNAMSIYKKKDNFWDTIKIRLGVDETTLDLSDPMDYIKWKVLLANNDVIAPSTRYMEDHPKETYRFVLVEEGAENDDKLRSLEIESKAYMYLGQAMNDVDKLGYLSEMMDKKPVSPKASREAILTKLAESTKRNPKRFVELCTDKYLEAKVLLRKCIAARLVERRGDYHYLAVDGSPMCEKDQNPTFNTAAEYLVSPKMAKTKLALEEELKSLKK